MIPYDKMLDLAREVWDRDYAPKEQDEYCAGMPVHRQSFVWGFQEAYDILCKQLKDDIKVVRKMREAQKEYEDAKDKVYSTHAFWGDNIPYEVHELLRKLTKKKKALQKEVDEYLKKM